MLRELSISAYFVWRLGEGRLTVDGHCSFSPDRNWVLNDTYPDRHDMRTLMLVRYRDQQRTTSRLAFRSFARRYKNESTSRPIGAGGWAF